jgi:thioredoxin-related protein
MLASSWIVAEDAVVPVTHDLAREAADARRDNVPVLLVFAQDHCDYCERLDRDVMNPNYASGAFAGRVHVRRVMIDSFQTTRDFDGRPLDQDALRSRFKVYVTPTVMLFDAKGNELAPRITGIENAEFYGAYLDIAIDDARTRLNAP